MDIDTLLRNKARIDQIFSLQGDSNSPVEHVTKVCHDVRGGTEVLDQDDSVPSTLQKLSTFQLLKKITDVKKEIASVSEDLDLECFEESFNNIHKSIGESIELTEEVASHLQCIHSASQLIEQVHRDPVMQDALPLPHHLHRSAVQMIEACCWIIQNRKWQPYDFEVIWENLLPKMQEDVHNWESLARTLDKYTKELQDIRLKLSTIVQHHPSFKP